MPIIVHSSEPVPARQVEVIADVEITGQPPVRAAATIWIHEPPAG